MILDSPSLSHILETTSWYPLPLFAVAAEDDNSHLTASDTYQLPKRIDFMRTTQKNEILLVVAVLEIRKRTTNFPIDNLSYTEASFWKSRETHFAKNHWIKSGHLSRDEGKRGTRFLSPSPYDRLSHCSPPFLSLFQEMTRSDTETTPPSLNFRITRILCLSVDVQLWLDNHGIRWLPKISSHFPFWHRPVITDCYDSPKEDIKVILHIFSVETNCCFGKWSLSWQLNRVVKKEIIVCSFSCVEINASLGLFHSSVN